LAPGASRAGGLRSGGSRAPGAGGDWLWGNCRERMQLGFRIVKAHRRIPVVWIQFQHLVKVGRGFGVILNQAIIDAASPIKLRVIRFFFNQDGVIGDRRFVLAQFLINIGAFLQRQLVLGGSLDNCIVVGCSLPPLLLAEKSISAITPRFPVLRI